MLPTSVKIKKIINENQTIKTLVLDDTISAQPGQFIMVWLPGIDEKPMSIVNDYPLTITFQILGSFTQKLATLQPGDKLGWRGPYGQGCFKLVGKKILLVAGGCGSAPLFFLAKRAREKHIAVDVVMGAQTSCKLFFEKEYEDIGCHNLICTDDGTKGFKGFTTVQVEDLLKTKKYDQVYACGPETMMSALKDILDIHRLAYQFSLERYMKCGLGICDQCSINGQLVCKDGPVFNQDQIKLLPDFGKFQRTKTGEKVTF